MFRSSVLGAPQVVHARTHARSTHARTHAHKVVGQGPDSPSHLHSRTYDYQHQPEAQNQA